MISEQDPEFDKTIGQLDFVLSKLMMYSKDAANAELSEPNRQTLKHHAEDMMAAGKKILERLGVEQEGTPQPDYERIAKIKLFRDRVVCSDAGAVPYLDHEQWDVERAVAYFFRSN